jgi:hypothetical protein
MHPGKNVKETKYEDSKTVESPSKIQRKGSDPISTVRDTSKKSQGG